MIRYILVFAAFLCGSARAQEFLQFVPMGYQQITSLSAAQSLTVPCATINGKSVCATSALIVPEAQAVRYREDGVAPTGAAGMPLAVGVPLKSTALTTLQFIEQTSGAKLNILYYR